LSQQALHFLVFGVGVGRDGVERFESLVEAGE